MSDNEIREILIERKKRMRKHQRLHETREFIEGFIAFAGLIFICFMLSVIGG